MKYTYKEVIPKFDLRNSSLSSLVSNAAVHLDDYSRGRNRDGESIEYLSQLLHDTTQGKRPRALNVEIMLILARTISGRESFEEYWKGKKNDAVLLSTNLVAKDLRDFKQLPKNKLENLREFCVSLSKEISAHYSEYYPIRRFCLVA